MSDSRMIADRFEILGPVARGNMGEVYRACDNQTGQTVAVKTILRRRDGQAVSLTGQDPNALRFEREVRIMSRLSSPHIPAIIDGGVDGDVPYLAMEYVDGITLRDLLAEEGGRLRVSWVAAVGQQIAEGLGAAHRAGVVHRDIKPSNVMVTEAGVVKVLDFGAGLILDDVDGGRLTTSGVAIGTARYMAPEQAEAAEPVTPAADLYALGCVLYELLAGAPPFDGENSFTVMTQHVEQQPVPVSALRGEVPEPVDALISRLLAKKPEDRPPDVGEVAEVLRPIAKVLGSRTSTTRYDPVRPLFTTEPASREPETAEPKGAELKPAVEESFDIFDVHQRLIADYRGFTEGSALLRDPRIAKFVEEDLDAKSQWPEPWLSLNPSFADGGSVADLARDGVLHPECATIFRRLKSLYQHQRDAIDAAKRGVSYVLTTGTGSGKSLSYIVPIVDRVLRAKETDPRPRVRAIIVYPMNALANSQLGELHKYLKDGVTFARYTGQESQEDRDKIRANPPDILLTNYVMLELLLTRPDDRRSLIAMADGLEFLVFDELHTYRGRQGADVAMLIRRVKDACNAPEVQCIGTSATMSTEGTVADRRAKVAEVATQIFGTEVSAENVIGETLVRATGENAGPVTEQRILAPTAPADYLDLVKDPLASWAETNFGLDRDEEGNLVRRVPTTVHDAAVKLAQQTDVDTARCEKALQRTLQAGSRARHPEKDRPLFAFRLHQFLSKGDTVYVTLEDESSRHITRDYQVEQPGTGKVLLPLAFCRECGQEYLVVWRRADKDGIRYTARRNAVFSDEDADLDGYLYLSGEEPWPRDIPTAIEQRRIPDSWLEVSERTGQEEVRYTMRKYLPEPVTVDAHGRECPASDGAEAAFIPGMFRFCLRCGVTYEGFRGRDFAKLATLDAEGRSSAISLISASIMRSLEKAAGLDKDARKLLTFVDNRQDASLQAGHFNDFVQVTMLRGALYRAAKQAVERGEDGLYDEDIAVAVKNALGLEREHYALNPGEEPALRRRTDTALRDVVNLRVYQDLERGWRVTMPNLEQTGLITIGYVGLQDAAANEGLWRNKTLRDASPDERVTLGTVVLNEMRRSLAIDAECFDEDQFDIIQKRSHAQLRAEWALGDGEKPRPGIVLARPGRSGGYREQVNMSGRGKVGRYVRRRFGGTSDDAQQVIRDLLEALVTAGLVTKVEASDRYNKSIQGYRVRASSLIWKPGDGEHGAEDPLSRTYAEGEKPRVNRYFVSLYQTVAAELKGLTAREHTAQVDQKVREQREEEFRTAELKLLYCSPTMELGVDIAGLNTVAMRNVPPTPANYAQRSGRAGRSGQPALVTTYCANGNSHDRYYFRRSEKMVAGSVAPPRLDLLNEDLIRSHVHAIWLAEAGVKLGHRIPESIDMSGTEPEGNHRPDPALKLNDTVIRDIRDANAASRAIERANTMLHELEDGLEAATSWWYPDWVEHVVRDAAVSFDKAFDRWRDLYRAALVDQWTQNKRRLDHSLDAKDRETARRRRDEAETQLRLLGNEDTDSRNLTADFNPYRYLASEGFLPGYSFPRLPIAAYIQVGGRFRKDGDFVQRPRFLAISEFGPNALIYHEGARYEVTRIQLPPDSAGEVATIQAHRCAACGYHHAVRPGTDRCEMCDAPLGEPLDDLLPLHTVFTRRRERISSDEEERRRAGFRVVTSYRFHDHGDRPGQLDAIVRDKAGAQIARLAYGDSATIRRTNLGPLRRAEDEPDGFLLDPTSGEWLPKSRAEADESIPRKRVIPYVEDRRNILVLQLATRVDEDVAGTLMYALERGIEAVFQLEDAELNAELLPPEDGPRDRMLFTESAEGGAGVLRRLQAEPDALARAAKEALRIAHFNPDTGANESDECGKACYDCLLSYGNQLWHEHIDRHGAHDLLLAFAGATTLSAGRGVSRTEQTLGLIRQADSTLEADFVQWLKDKGYRLPDAGQTTIENAHARPDFVYRRANGDVAVFVDGPVHDDETVAQRDADATERLEDEGWWVIRIRHDENWQQVVSKYPSVFGTGR